MHRLFLYCFCFLLVGCSNAPPPAKVDISKQSLFGGVYELEIEKVKGTDPMLVARETKVGDGSVEYFLDCKAGPNRFIFEKGALTFNGKDYGTLQRGDKLKLTLAGKLYVNGSER